MMDITTLSVQEIENLIKEKEDVRHAQSTCLFEVEKEDNTLAKQSVELSVKRKVLKDAILRAKHTIQTLSLEIKQLDRQKWQTLRNERGF